MRDMEVYPCICGGVPKIGSLLDQNKYFYVVCAKCQRITDVSYSMKKAIKTWNLS